MKTAHPPTEKKEDTGDQLTTIGIKSENGEIVAEPDTLTEIKTTDEEVKTEPTPEQDEDFAPLITRGQFDCSKCLRSFKCRTSWLKHIERPHSFPCKTCKRGYATGRDLQDHSCLFKCPECDKGLKSVKALRKHRHVHRPSSKRFECAHCGICFSTKTSLCSHIRSRGEHTYPEQQLWCMPCGRRFSSGLALKHHTARRHNSGVFPCCKCHKPFDTKEERLAHTREVHPKKKLLFDCPECGKKLSSRGSVKLHVNTVHKKLKPSLCQVRLLNCYLIE
jgi:transcription elongation factor Elf1